MQRVGAGDEDEVRAGRAGVQEGPGGHRESGLGREEWREGSPGSGREVGWSWDLRVPDLPLPGAPSPALYLGAFNLIACGYHVVIVPLQAQEGEL